MNFDKTISAILIVVLAVFVIGTVYLIVNPNPGPKFTEFYILGNGNQAGNYNVNLTSYEQGNVTVGIVNHEQATTSYNLLVILNGTTIHNENVTLTSNETKMIPITYSPVSTGKQTLNFELYKLPDTTNVYRSLYLYLNVT